MRTWGAIRAWLGRRSAPQPAADLSDSFPVPVSLNPAHERSDFATAAECCHALSRAAFYESTRDSCSDRRHAAYCLALAAYVLDGLVAVESSTHCLIQDLQGQSPAAITNCKP
jgi:hypothetical protein